MGLKNSLIAVIIAGIVTFAISQIVSYLAAMLFPFNVLELAGMRSVNDPVMLLFFLYSWVVAFAMVIAYNVFQKALQGRQKGLRFGLTCWILAGIPSFFVVFSSMSYPIGFSISSLVGGFLSFTAAGLVIAKISG